MRYFIAAILVWLVASGIIYALGSFVAASFNITEWSTDGRLLAAFLSLMALVAVTGGAIQLNVERGR